MQLCDIFHICHIPKTTLSTVPIFIPHTYPPYKYCWQPCVSGDNGILHSEHCRLVLMTVPAVADQTKFRPAGLATGSAGEDCVWVLWDELSPPFPLCPFFLALLLSPSFTLQDSCPHHGSPSLTVFCSRIPH